MIDANIKYAAIRFYFLYKGKAPNIIKDIVQIFPISSASFYLWRNEYNLTGKIQKNSIIGRPINSGKINDSIEQYVIKRFTNGNINIKNLRRSIKRIFTVSIKKSSIYNILKKNKITHKRISVDRSPYTEKERKDKHNTLRTQLNFNGLEYNNDNVISYDESYMSGEKLTKEYGWAKSGHKAVLKVNGRRYCRGTSMLMAITNKTTVACKTQKGSIKGDNICDFIMNDVIKNESGKILFMDNAKSHTNKKLAAEMLRTGNKIVFNIPYHPQNNPIEYLNNVVKQQLKNQYVENIDDLDKKLAKIIKKIPEQIYANCFNKAYKCISAN